MKTTIALAFFATAAGLGCQEKSVPALPNQAAATSNAAFALVVENKETMGCLANQRLLDDATSKLTRGQPVSISGGQVSEDSALAKVLYVGFTATGDSGLDGALTFKVWAEPKSATEPGAFEIKGAHLDWRKDAWVLTFSAKGTGELRLEPQWTRSSQLEPVWRTCPSADLLEPFRGTFLNAQKLDVALEPDDKFALSSDFKQFETKVSGVAFDGIRAVSQLMSGLENMAKRFGTAEDRWTWDRSKLDSDALAHSMYGFGGGVAPFVKVTPDGDTAIVSHKSDFKPLVRFHLVLLGQNGVRKGAEVLLAMPE